MRILKNTDKKMKITLPPSSRVPIQTSDNLFTHHCNQIICGKRGSGKSIYTTNYLRLLKQENKADRIFIISPTVESNRALLDILDIDEEDIFDPEDNDAITKVLNYVNQERDDYVRDLKKIKRWKLFCKLVKSNTPVHHIDPYLLLEFADKHGNPIEPKLKYGHRPILHLWVDDCQSSPLFRQRKYLNFVIRHRHVGGMPFEKHDKEMCGSIGISHYCCVQNIKAASGGLPRAIKNNATQMVIVGKSKDEQELKDIYSSVSGEICYNDFTKAYEYATKEPHSSLVIDLHPKKPYMRFRKNLNEFIDFSTENNVVKDKQ